MNSKATLVLGASGSIGRACVDAFHMNGHEIWVGSRTDKKDDDRCLLVSGQKILDEKVFSMCPKFDAVVWAQGVNLNDSVKDFDQASFENLFTANVGYVLSTLNTLIGLEKLNIQARLCVISSIWQEVIRPEKMSYSISKASLGALVKSCAVDLAELGFLINAVLPGVLETPMTRSVLSLEQMAGVENATGFKRLVTPVEVAQLVYFLCSEANTAITGQSIPIDLGFSNVRPI